MNKNYKSICALLSIESIALTDGKASLTDEQLTALDKALEMKLQVISDLEAQVAANQRDGSFGLPLAYVWCAYGMQTKSYYVCSGNVVWGWRWR